MEPTLFRSRARGSFWHVPALPFSTSGMTESMLAGMAICGPVSTLGGVEQLVTDAQTDSDVSCQECVDRLGQVMFATLQVVLADGQEPSGAPITNNDRLKLQQQMRSLAERL